MGANKKPRKAYQARVIRIPRVVDVHMASDAHPQLAMQLYAALITLIERPTIGSMNQMSDQLCRIAGGMSHAAKGAPILGKTDAHSIAINSAIRCIESIVERDERTGTLKVTDTEAKTLRTAAGVLDGALGNIPASAYAMGSRELDRHLANAGGMWAREQGVA